MSDDEFREGSVQHSREILRRFGDGFVGQDAVVVVKSDASDSACKEALVRLCRHLSHGEIEAAENEGFDFSSVFELAPRGSLDR